MDPDGIDELLAKGAESDPPGLPAGFARAALRRAHEIRALIQRHRNWLLVSTLVALSFSTLISVRIRHGAEPTPPPIHPFDSPEFTQPGPSLR